ncbi:MAG TPA: hypothetical protein VKG92_05435, partial [Flavobacteriales bacterium]|nr:hypothetical protein [Flavobacteriales bacterium]
ALPQHGSSLHPITSIVALRDGHTVHFPPLRSGFRGRLFGDPLFFRAYMACLDTFSNKGWLELLLRRLSEGYAMQERIVVSEYPQSRPDASVFAHNRTVIHRTLHPPDLVLAYAQETPGGDRALAIANVHALPVEITGFIAGTDTVRLSTPLFLWPREPDKPLVYVPSRITVPRGYQGSISLVAGIPGTSERRAVLVRTWSSFTAN